MPSPIFKPQGGGMPRPSKTLIAACVICAALLQGCGATLPTCPNASPELPSPPSLSTPAPAQPYSKSWQIEVDEWRSVVEKSRARLTAIPLTPR